MKGVEKEMKPQNFKVEVPEPEKSVTIMQSPRIITNIGETNHSNPLFNVAVLDQNEPYEQMQRAAFVGNSKEKKALLAKLLRIRLIKSLNMMKRLKLTPKDVKSIQ